MSRSKKLTDVQREVLTLLFEAGDEGWTHTRWTKGGHQGGGSISAATLRMLHNHRLVRVGKVETEKKEVRPRRGLTWVTHTTYKITTKGKDSLRTGRL